MLSQILWIADPERINTFYIVTHVGHFEAEGDTAYLDANATTGQVTRHPAFDQDLAYWEETMEQLVRPLVEAGYLQWTSLPEIGELFVQWERDCSGR
jgi:hypothetical protein